MQILIAINSIWHLMASDQTGLVGSQGSPGEVIAEEVALGRLRRYRHDGENSDVMVIEDSQVTSYVLPAAAHAPSA